MYEQDFSERESTKNHLRKTVNRQVEAMTEEEVKELLLQTTDGGQLGEESGEDLWQLTDQEFLQLLNESQAGEPEPIIKNDEFEQVSKYQRSEQNPANDKPEPKSDNVKAKAISSTDNDNSREDIEGKSTQTKELLCEPMKVRKMLW